MNAKKMEYLYAKFFVFLYIFPYHMNIPDRFYSLPGILEMQ